MFPLTDTAVVPDAPIDAPIDAARQAMLEEFTAALGDSVVASHITPGKDLMVRVTNQSWAEAGRVARDVLGCTFFSFLAGLDWMPSPYGKGEDDPTAEPVARDLTIKQGYTGGDTRMQVFARVVNPETKMALTLKVDVADDDPRVGSWVNVYAGANWHERECWEMYGIVFDGHGDLRKLYLPGDFEGFPLRKDFPLVARIVKPWPGIVDVEPMPGGGNDDEESE